MVPYLAVVTLTRTKASLGCRLCLFYLLDVGVCSLRNNSFLILESHFSNQSVYFLYKCRHIPSPNFLMLDELQVTLLHNTPQRMHRLPVASVRARTSPQKTSS